MGQSRLESGMIGSDAGIGGWAWNTDITHKECDPKYISINATAREAARWSKLFGVNLII